MQPYIYETVGWLGYVTHSMTVRVPSSACEVWVVVPGCLLGWLGLFGWAACLVLVPGCLLRPFGLSRLCSLYLSATRRLVAVRLR